MDIPGGGVEEGETFEEALVREVQEETSLSIKSFDIIKAWNCIYDGKMLYGITFAAQYVSGKVLLSQEHEKYCWVDIDEVKKLDIEQWIKEEIDLLKINFKK